MNNDTLLSDFLKTLDDNTGASPVNTLFERFLEFVMKAERDEFVNSDPDNKANGYTSRSLQTGSLNLHPSVARDRNGEFRSELLPPRWQRQDQSADELLMALVQSGYSHSKVRKVLRKLGLSYNKQKMQNIKERFLREVEDFKTRELKSDYFAMFIDAYRCEVKNKGKIMTAQAYSCIGVDLEGNKDLLAFRIVFGAENKTDWIKLFRDLVSRGLEGVCMIISDDLSGMRNAVKEVFPESDHQLCYVHLMRNIKGNMRNDDAKEFIKQLRIIRDSCSDFDEGVESMKELMEDFKEKYPGYIELLENKHCHYLQFLKYPDSIRKHFYTTNQVETFNSLLERMRYEKGWHFKCVENLEIALLLTYKHLRADKWSRPIPNVKARQFHLKRLYNLKYADV